MNSTLLHEVQEDILLVNSEFLEVVQLGSKFIFKLTFFFQEISLISVIKSFFVLGQGVELIVLSPGIVSVTSQSVGLNLDGSATSQQMHIYNLILQRSEIPDSGNPHNIGDDQIDVIPLPSQFKRVHIPEEKGSRDQALIHAVGIFEENFRMFEGLARVDKNFSISVKFNCICGFVNSTVFLDHGQVIEDFNLIFDVFIIHIFNVTNSA
mmetsp:Transcript_12660/g.10820  ORF Transcript_12660/g.10820 Transcript_12660/m.10820 type:complete len:209 (-) Transcript_12660:129-755(-)